MKRRKGASHSAAGKAEPEVFLYTDGACSGNPGPGGWAFILKHPASGKVLESSGAEKWTTNNQMELRAVIEGLKTLKRPVHVRIVTDSSYVATGMTDWCKRWKANGWRRKTPKGYQPVQNLELWQELDAVGEPHRYELERIRGHDGHPENERCDELAVQAYLALKGRS